MISYRLQAITVTADGNTEGITVDTVNMEVMALHMVIPRAAIMDLTATMARNHTDTMATQRTAVTRLTTVAARTADTTPSTVRTKAGDMTAALATKRNGAGTRLMAKSQRTVHPAVIMPHIIMVPTQATMDINLTEQVDTKATVLMATTVDGIKLGTDHITDRMAHMEITAVTTDSNSSVNF